MHARLYPHFCDPPQSSSPLSTPTNCIMPLHFTTRFSVICSRYWVVIVLRRRHPVASVCCRRPLRSLWMSASSAPKKANTQPSRPAFLRLLSARRLIPSSQRLRTRLSSVTWTACNPTPRTWQQVLHQSCHQGLQCFFGVNTAGGYRIVDNRRRFVLKIPQPSVVSRSFLRFSLSILIPADFFWFCR